MAVRARHVLGATLLAAGALGWGARDAWPWRRPLTAPPIAVPPPYVEWADTLRRHETLSDVLTQAGIAGADQAALLAAATALDARRLRAGTVLQFRRLRSDPAADRLTLRPSLERRVSLARRDSAWIESVETIPWRVTRLRVSGRIGSSLYEAVDAAVPDSLLPPAERVALAWAIADVYDWVVDFTRDVRPGDRYDVVLDRLESPEGERRFGRIWAARVDAARVPNYAFYFEGGADPGFYDADGRSLRRAFLRTPLQFRRVSSRFGGRFHPILKQWRSHAGIDYSAASGTPVRATADGSVARAGRDGGYGNLVELRHVNGIRTRYGHLSRFGPGIAPGARVRQGQTIGYVGSTGLSTGPHLHYEFLVNGRPTNPRRQDAGSGRPVPDVQRSAFAAERARLLAQLEPPPLPVASRPE
jgi:murein DD-endopeptidase MepM/ murein hydrolase activator NlpD